MASNDMDESLVESLVNGLKVSKRFLLRENLKKLELELEKNIKVRPNEEQEELKKRFWLHLVKESLEMRNMELSLYAIAKMKCIQLALLMRKTLQQVDDSKISESIAFSYVSSYFQIPYNSDNNINLADQFSFANLKQQDNLIDHFLDNGDWKKCLSLIENSSCFDEKSKKIKKQLVHFKIAQHLEIDENLKEAISYYEQSGVSGLHIARVIIKRHLEYSTRELERYCKARKSMEGIWKGFKSFNTRKDLHLIRNEDFALPNDLVRFNANSGDNEKWFNKKSVHSLMTMGTALDSTTRGMLVELAIKYQHQGQFSKAASLYLCLNHIDAFVSIISYFMDKDSCLKVISCFLNQESIAETLIDYLLTNSSMTTMRGSSKSRCKLSNYKVTETLIESFLKLGLLNEVLCEFAKNSDKYEKFISNAVEYLESLVEAKRLECLTLIDPELDGSTLIAVQKALTGNQILSTHVITFVILSASIFLFKLDESDHAYGLDFSILKLESTFQSLNDYLDKLTFSASDALVRSVTQLIGAAKEKLDALTESDIIRNGLRHLVESIASRCMIESRYKNAAKLYSQIEDNINAIKSLMRTGDTNVVINYSLLVRDSTVNRITMSYLKHLNVNPAVIDDFISKCKI